MPVCLISKGLLVVTSLQRAADLIPYSSIEPYGYSHVFVPYDLQPCCCSSVSALSSAVSDKEHTETSLFATKVSQGEAESKKSN